MAYTLSWHQGGEKEVRQAHNRREHNATGNRDIDTNKTKDNITLIDIPIKQAYKDIFQPAVDEYNSRVRESRKIKNYYNTIQKGKKQTAYEIIVQIGSMAEGSPKQTIEALKEYVDTWKHRNPNMQLIGAYIHLDENTPHLHLDYIPIAQCNRGMKIQNSLTRALENQGFISQSAKNTAQMQWEQAERNSMREICQNMGIELEEQGIGRKRHLNVAEHKELQEKLKELTDAITKLEYQKEMTEFNLLTLESKEKQLNSDNEELKKANKQLKAMCANLQVIKEQYENDGYAYLQECMNFREIVEAEYPDYSQEVIERLYGTEYQEQIIEDDFDHTL